MTAATCPVQVLLVEDGPGDVALISDAFAGHRLPSMLHIAADGDEALEFLRRGDVHADAVRLDLILLDLNMPRMDGRELLTVVKADADLRTIPVVVFTTTTTTTEDVTSSYQAYANAYVTQVHRPLRGRARTRKPPPPCRRDAATAVGRGAMRICRSDGALALPPPGGRRAGALRLAGWDAAEGRPAPPRPGGGRAATRMA